MEIGLNMGSSAVEIFNGGREKSPEKYFFWVVFLHIQVC